MSGGSNVIPTRDDMNLMGEGVGDSRFDAMIPGVLKANKAFPCVEAYFAVRASIETARGNIAAGVDAKMFGAPPKNAKANVWMDSLAKWLPEARLFEIKAKDWNELHSNVDRYVCESFVGWKYDEKHLDVEDNRDVGDPLAWDMKRFAPPLSREELDSSDFVEKLAEASQSVTWEPHEQPFPVCFIGFDRVLWPSTLEQHIRRASWNRTQGQEGLDPDMPLCIVGYLILAGERGGEIVEFQGVTFKDARSGTEPTAIIPSWHRSERWVHRYSDEGAIDPFGPAPWSVDGTYTPWLMAGIIEAIGRCRSFVMETGFGHKRRSQQAAKKLGFAHTAPRPFYRVKLADSFTIRTIARKVVPHVAIEHRWSHQWEVKGHDRVRVLRDALPLDLKTRADLLRREYVIFDDRDPPDDIMRKLYARGIPKRRPDEWIAVLVSPVSHHWKGPPDKPRIPAVRVLDRIDSE